jgi:integrase/recombinase XerC
VGGGLADARRQDVEAFLADLLQRRSATTASVRYRALRVFYDWLEQEGEVPESPMWRMSRRRCPTSRWMC